MKKPDEAELLAWLDGDLGPERREEIQQQLAADWELRTTLAQLERRIGKYVEATRHQSPVEIEPFEDFWRDLSPHLDDLSTPQTPVLRRALTRLRSLRMPQLSGWRLAGVFAVTLLITTGLLIYLSLSTRVRTVSAEELLQRSMRGEDLRLKQLPEPVVYRKLWVKRIGSDEPLTLESWNDPQRKQFRQRVADKQGRQFLRAEETPAIIAELEQIFRANHFDPQQPLSAAAFTAWRSSIRTKAETVNEQALPGSNHNDGLELVTIAQESYGVNTITMASLLVRKSDWHAMALQFKVQGQGEIRAYELSETAYEVLPLQALTVFADLAATPSASSAPRPSPSRLPAVVASLPTPSLTPAVTLPSAAALQEAEVTALFILYQLKADLGEQIEVLHDANRQLIVRGLIETEARKQQLNEALRAVPFAILNLQTVEELARQVTAKAPTNATETDPLNGLQISPLSTPATSVNSFHQYLEKYFVESGNDRRHATMKAAQLANTVVSETAAALSEAWALRRLSERFNLEQETQFTLVNRQRITEMRRNYLARLQMHYRALRLQLNPVLTTLAGKTTAPTTISGGNRQAQALRLFKAVEQFAHLSNSLLAGTSGSSPESAARRLLATLAQVDGALQSFEQANSK